MNNSINHNYNIEIEVLSPLHIGSGSEKDWVKGLDFIQDKGNLIKLNTRKMYGVLSNDIHKLSALLVNKNGDGLKKLIGNKLDTITEETFKINVDSSNDIKAFIKTGFNNKPYIPGSSLKGAIRSILLKHFLNGTKPDRLYEKDYFGSSTDGDEFMRFVKISDAQFEKTELVNTKIFNLFKEDENWQGGWKHKGERENETNSKFKPIGFNTIYEIIDKKQKSKIFTISLSEKQVDNFNKNNDINQIKLNKKEILQEYNKIPFNLFSIINEYTKEYIKREINFFEKYSNEQTDNIIENLEKILEFTKEKNSCVLRMSAGSGFHSVTGDWQFEEHFIDEIEVNNGRSRGKYQHKKSAKSRKIAVSDGNYMPMGFVKLKVITDEEIKQKEQEEAERRKIELQEAEQKRIEREEQEKIKQEFKNIIQEADTFFVEKQYEKAIEKYNEAQKLDKNVDLSLQYKKCEAAMEILKEEQEVETKRIENIEFLKQKEQEEKQKQEANKKQLDELLNKGLSVLANIDEFTKGKNIIKKFKQNTDIDKQEFDYIKSFIKCCIDKNGDKGWASIKRDNWKDVSSWVGKKTAEQWFSEINKK
jgi:CRISPR type III-A-associated RAMP protein Csm5